MKNFLKWLAGESLIQLYHDVRAGKKNLYLCDPVTAAIIIGFAVGGTIATVGVVQSIDKKSSDNGGAMSAYTPPEGVSDTGSVTDVGSVETQAAQRRLARLTRYFTTPSGVLNDATGSTGVF